MSLEIIIWELPTAGSLAYSNRATALVRDAPPRAHDAHEHARPLERGRERHTLDLVRTIREDDIEGVGKLRPHARHRGPQPDRASSRTLIVTRDLLYRTAVSCKARLYY